MQDDPQIHGEATGLRAASDRGNRLPHVHNIIDVGVSTSIWLQERNKVSETCVITRTILQHYAKIQ